MSKKSCIKKISNAVHSAKDEHPEHAQKTKDLTITESLEEVSDSKIMAITKKRFKKIATMRESTVKEANYKKSETVPDQSLTVREIMEKFASGTLPDITRELEFTEDLPDLRGLDISQVHAMRDNNRNDIQQMEDSVRQAKANKQQKPAVEEAVIIPEEK